MPYRRSLIHWMVLAMVVIGPLSLSGAGASGPRSPAVIANLELQPTRIDWRPQMGYERLILTVAGPGDLYIRQELEAGQAPSLTPGDSKGNPLPDGIYAYELRAMSRQDGGHPLVQSGYFSVREGIFVDKASTRDETSHRGKPGSKRAPDTAGAKSLTTESVCIGAGCGSGDDSIPVLTLKDNVVRLTFEDVSDSISYDRDWAVQANDFLGGSDRFFVLDLDAGTTPFSIEGTAPDHALYVRSNGNLGLGTSTPAVRLDVQASSGGAAVQRLQNSSATGYSGIEYLNNAGAVKLFFGVDNAATNTRLNSISNYPIVVLTNSTERMRVTSAGSIGIGTSTPSSLFHVNGGDIRVSGGSFIDDGVTLNVPDYVFEPGYRLMPLSELREFVLQEKHLPNVPKAEEVKQRGLNLSQFQMRLLEKVEELTIYTLQQDERLNAQQEEMSRLKEQNAVLLERLAALEKAPSEERKP